MAVQRGTCASLKTTVRIAMLNNIKFKIHYEYEFENGHKLPAIINGVMNVKKVIDSNVEPIFEEATWCLSKSSHLVEVSYLSYVIIYMMRNLRLNKKVK